MALERIRRFLLQLPHVVETEQWGGSLVFWVGDKAVGGKMFAVSSLDRQRRAVISYAAGSERYTELLELDGLFPAPYLARAYWVAADRWDVYRPGEWEQELRAAHDLTLQKLSPKTRRILALPKREMRRTVAASRKPSGPEAPISGSKGR
jgi:predicted DNA-binding protein (MmcQ/YjbR family)